MACSTSLVPVLCSVLVVMWIAVGAQNTDQSYPRRMSAQYGRQYMYNRRHWGRRGEIERDGTLRSWSGARLPQTNVHVNPSPPRPPQQACSIDSIQDLQSHLPGLFMSENDVLNKATRDAQFASNRQFVQQQPVREIPLSSPVVNQGQNRGISQMGMVMPFGTGGSTCGCCKTVSSVSVYTRVNIEGLQYDTVNITRHFQFTQIGKCQQEGASCCGGRCFQMHRYQWVMIWNLTLSVRPPIQFAPVQFPSHCECINAFWGRP